MGSLLLLLPFVVATSPVDLRAALVLLLPVSANTMSIVAGETLKPLATARALGLAGTLTRDVSTSSTLVKWSPR